MSGYKPSENPRNPHGPHKLTARPVHLLPRAEVAPEHRPPLLPGRKSRRERKNVWVAA